MNGQERQKQQINRREFIGAAAALAATPFITRMAQAEVMPKPNSKFNGVQIGAITYSYRSLPGSAEDILEHVTKCGISSIELMGGPAEAFAKAKSGSSEKFPSMDGFKALRKMYNDAGVNIHIIKFGNIGDGRMSDEQIEYYFNAAKAVGAMGITRELSEEAAQRLGPIADKHGVWIGFHNHTQLKPDTYDGKILTYGNYLGINLDIGHYVAGTNHSPLPLIEKFKNRIISLHIKDRKVNNGPNMPLGQGDTPVALVLQYMKRNKLAFPADIELEYRVPKDSDAIKEVTKCVEFCKKSLA